VSPTLYYPEDVSSAPFRLEVSPEVAAAVAAGRPVVALESTLIAHGLPRPDNLQTARAAEAIVRQEGAVPATVGVVAGVPTVGLDGAALERLATRQDVAKLSARDLAPAAALGLDGATTVAGTAVLATRAGIRLFATGGLGGVHRGARETWDESADLLTLGRTSIAVVCAGVKSILDIGATLERLESLNVAVCGFRTHRFPAFYLADSGFPLDWSVADEHEAATLLAAHFALDPTGGGVVLANPIPVAEQLDPELHRRALASGLEAAARQGVTGKAVTPFLLEQFRRLTEGASLRVNTRIILENARLAARVAGALCALSRPPGG
jgi:pseudouridine-5'-phosphate glycosidase